MGFARCFSYHIPGDSVSISFLRGAPQVGSAGTKEKQINSKKFSWSPMYLYANSTIDQNFCYRTN